VLFAQNWRHRFQHIIVADEVVKNCKVTALIVARELNVRV
jgi:hypothetical protein